MLDLVGMAEKARAYGGDLDPFERRLMDVAKCLVGTPKRAVFDEPAFDPAAEVLADAQVKAACLGTEELGDGARSDARLEGRETASRFEAAWEKRF